MTWILEAGLFLSIFPLFVLASPRLRERRKWMFVFALGAELAGVVLVLLYFGWRVLSPFRTAE